MDSPTTRTLYDRVPYPCGVYDWTHPDQLAVRARLAGMQPAPAEKCRVLELGCGDGLNLIAMAQALPGSEFLGIDLAAAPLNRGRALADELGLKNLTLRQADILKLGDDLGPFDYILAPGVYSWVPAAVREKLIALCGAHLAPQGVAIINYNALPGAYLSAMTRAMMRHHTRTVTDPTEQLRQAGSLLKLIAAAHPEPDAYRLAIGQELARLSRTEDELAYHDDFNPHYHPVFLHQFTEHAAKHALQYLGDRIEFDIDPAQHPPALHAALADIAKGDPVSQQQYLDYIQGRRFRWTLLSRANIPLQPAPTGCTRAFTLTAEPPAAAEANGVFHAPAGGVVKTDDRLAIAALRKLRAAWPAALDMNALLTSAFDFPALESFLLRCRAVGVVNFHLHAPRLTSQISTRPQASPLARLVARTSARVPSQRHHSIALDAPHLRLVTLLDGTRDRPALQRECNIATPAELEAQLTTLARHALLIA